MLLRAWADSNGDLFRVERQGSRYFIESITPALEPRAGKVSRRYVTKSEANEFDPDPVGELDYHTMLDPDIL
jgi:hypothetical protein